MRDGRRVLLPLGLVCRRWSKIAVEILYEEIQLDDCKRSFTIMIENLLT